MTETTDTDTGTEVDEQPDDAEQTEDTGQTGTGQADDAERSDDEETFPRSVVEKLRQENGKYRQRAQRADELAQRLHTALVKESGRLADPTDLEFNPDHLDDPDALTAAVDELLTRKPHLASRKPVGDVGQGARGAATSDVSLLDLMKGRA